MAILQKFRKGSPEVDRVLANQNSSDSAFRPVLEPNHAIVEAANIAGIGLAIFSNRRGDPAIAFINDAACSIAGRTAEDVTSQAPFHFISRESWKKIVEKWEPLMSGELATDSLEIEVIHKRGDHVAVSLSLSAAM